MPSGLLERMRRNPAGDWRIGDVEAICREFGYSVLAKGLRIATRNIRPRAKY